MNWWAEVLVVIGAAILTGGGGYVVVLGHVSRTNQDSGFVAVVVAMIGAVCLTIGLLILHNRSSIR
jgi:hypothetical protein